MPAPPITDDLAAIRRACIWEPFKDDQPLTITPRYLLDLLKRAGVVAAPAETTGYHDEVA